MIQQRHEQMTWFYPSYTNEPVRQTLTINFQSIRGDGHREAIRWSIFVRLRNFLYLEKQIFLFVKPYFSEAPL